MPNDWNHNKAIDVVSVEAKYFEPYGFLHFFTVQNKITEKQFIQATPNFSKKEVKLGPNAAYTLLTSREPKPLLNLNRGDQQKGYDWAIGQAKKNYEERQALEEGYKKKLEDQKGEPAEQDWIQENIFDKYKKEFGKESQSNNWYKNAKTFINKMVKK